MASRMRIIITILIFALLNVTSTVFSAGKTNIIIDNKQLVTEREAFVEKGRVMVPLRKSAEAMGYSVSWDPAEKSVSLSGGKRLVYLRIGSDEAVVDIFDDSPQQEILKLDVAPLILDGSTFVPLRFIAERMGAFVEWDQETTTVNIITPMLLTPSSINGGKTGIFYRRQLGFDGYNGIMGDITLPEVPHLEQGDCPYVYFGFDGRNDGGNAEGGFQYIFEPDQPGFGKWTPYIRQGSAWRWSEEFVALEPGTTHRLKFYIDEFNGKTDLVLTLDGKEAIRLASSYSGFNKPGEADKLTSVKSVIAMAMSKNFDGKNCFSSVKAAKIGNMKVSAFTSDPRLDEGYFAVAPSKYYREWRDVAGHGVFFGTVECVPSYMHFGADGLSIYKTT